MFKNISIALLEEKKQSPSQRLKNLSIIVLFVLDFTIIRICILVLL